MQTILLYMPNHGESGCIQLWFAGDRHWTEARCDIPYSMWSDERAVTESDMFKLHAGLDGMHTTVLHQDQILALAEHMRDYMFARAFLGG